MVSLTTQRVTISVETFFQDQYSDATQRKYIFAYQVRISNNSHTPIKLLDRHWTIVLATGEHRQVSGAGVVGQQPVILPGEAHEYTSWVQLETPIGAMYGSYGMSRPEATGNQRDLFRVGVPKFVLMAPEALN